MYVCCHAWSRKSALCGICVSLLWPGTLVIASEKIPYGSAAMFVLLAAVGDIGASMGPWVMGKVTDFMALNESVNILSGEQIGLRVGMVAVAIFPTVTVILHKVLKNRKIES